MPDKRDIINEKELINSLSQNLWIVDFTEQMYDLHGHWMDNITDEDIQEIDSTLQQAMDEFTGPNGKYDTDRINSLSESELRNRSKELNRAGSTAAGYFQDMYQRVQGHVDMTDQIPNIIDNSVRNSFNEIIDEGDFTAGEFDVSVTTEVDDDTLDLIYNRVEQSIEANLGGTVDDETMDNIYDQLTDIQTEIESQGRQTRQHVTDQHGDTQGYIDDRHSDTQDYIGDKHDETQTRVTSEAEETRDRIDDVDGRLDDIEGKLGGKSGRRGFLKKALALAGLTGATYLVAEQLHDGDELTNITWDDADRELSNGGGNVSLPDNYSGAWDNTSISKWNSFVDRVPGEVEEVYTESATGQEYVVVENQDNEAFQVGYDELDLNAREEASLETSDNYLEFFEFEE